MGVERLSLGWNDTVLVKNLQQDVCTEAVRALQARSVYHQHETTKQQTLQASTTTTKAINPPINYREDYNKDSDSKPCYAWNWGKDCWFQASHGNAPDNMLHVCAWYVYKFKCQLAYKEQDCLKKRRFLDKKTSASTTATNTMSLKCCTNHVWLKRSY